VLGNVLITLSGITPAASVFIIAPVALAEAGSGAFTSFVFAAIVGVFMGLCWAELSAAFPIAGGDYALVWHSFKGPAASRRVSALAGPVSAARDRAFPGPVSGWMAQIQPRYRSPWVATAVIGVVGAVLFLTVSLGTLVNLTGASLVADYALIAIAALVARPVKATEHSPYKMRFWPLPPLLGLISLGYVFTKQTALLLDVTLITMGIGLVYWLIVIMPQRGRAWHLLDAASSELAPPDPAPASAADPADPAGAA
jgi:amino acid transporter